MQIKIDYSSDRAVYQQIVDQIKRDLALGRIKSDEKLPTVREMAAFLVINPNTVAKAYKRLEQEGIITTRSGSGTFAAGSSTKIDRDLREKIVCNEIERAVVDAVHMQVQKPRLKKWFEEIIARFKWPNE